MAYTEYEIVYIPEGYRPRHDVLSNVSDEIGALHTMMITSAGLIKIVTHGANIANAFSVRVPIAYVL